MLPYLLPCILMEKTEVHNQSKLEMIPELIHINALSRLNSSLCRTPTILFKVGWLFFHLCAFVIHRVVLNKAKRFHAGVK